MGEQITAEMPCIRGCTYPARIEGEDPSPRPAKHGQLCTSCYWRLRHALNEIPNLMANMRLKIDPIHAAQYDGEKVSREKRAGSPAPLNIDPLDDADALLAKLALWTDDLGEKLNVRPPSIRIWMGSSEPQGFHVVSPASAHDIATQFVHWFTTRLDDIADTNSAAAFHDDIAWGWEDPQGDYRSPGVFKLKGQYGIEPRPLRAADKRECPVCGEREVIVKWPDLFDPDIAVLCGRCHWVAEPERYTFYAELFKRA